MTELVHTSPLMGVALKSVHVHKGDKRKERI